MKRGSVSDSFKGLAYCYTLPHISTRGVHSGVSCRFACTTEFHVITDVDRLTLPMVQLTKSHVVRGPRYERQRVQAGSAPALPRPPRDVLSSLCTRYPSQSISLTSLPCQKV